MQSGQCHMKTPFPLVKGPESQRSSLLSTSRLMANVTSEECSRDDDLGASSVCIAKDDRGGSEAAVKPFADSEAEVPCPPSHPADLQASLARQPSSTGHVGNENKADGASISCTRPRCSGGGLSSSRRWGGSCHNELYEDALIREQRLCLAKEYTEHAHEAKHKLRLEQHAEDMRQWRRLYRTKDSRTHLEREQEHLRRKREKQARNQRLQHRREMDELRECTFRPDLSKKGRRAMAATANTSGLANDSSISVHGVGNAATERSSDKEVEVRIRRLVAKQHAADAQLRMLTSKEAELQDMLRVMRADLLEATQREQTEHVVAMLQANSSCGGQRDLVQQVQNMVAAGSRPEVAQLQIVGNLVARSQDEALRRVEEAIAPLQQKAESSLSDQRLKILQDLEAIEDDAAALLGMCGNEEAARLGFELDLAERSRSKPHVKPPESRSSPSLEPSSVASSIATQQMSTSCKSAPSITQEALAMPWSPRSSLRCSTRNTAATSNSPARSLCSDARGRR